MKKHHISIPPARLVVPVKEFPPGWADKGARPQQVADYIRQFDKANTLAHCDYIINGRRMKI